MSPITCHDCGNYVHIKSLLFCKGSQRECTEIFFINCNTLLHVSTLLGHLQGETFRCPYTWVHYRVERECAVDMRTVNSTFSLNSIVQPSVRTTESFSLKMTQQGRNM
jgi:hypothetical protein